MIIFYHDFANLEISDFEYQMSEIRHPRSDIQNLNTLEQPKLLEGVMCGRRLICGCSNRRLNSERIGLPTAGI